MATDLDGKVALVTGASRGIGKAIALELAAAGCDLLLTARDQGALDDVATAVRTLGRKAECMRADLRDDEPPAALAKRAAQHFGRLDILVNNAGASRRGDFFKQTDADWQAGFALKFFAQVRLCRAAWPLLRAAGGSVVAIGGIGAPRPGRRLHDRLLGDRRAECVHEGARRPRQARRRAGQHGPSGFGRHRPLPRPARHRHGAHRADEAAAIEHHRRELNITRFGQPQDVAGLVAFIVSPRGRWLHGAGIDMDGGQVEPLRMSRYD